MKRSLLAAASLTLLATPALAASSDSDGPVAGLGIAIFLVFYFFPSIIAWRRGHHNTLAIFLLNLLLGWTVLCWIGALVWAATQVQRPIADNIRIVRED
jgi:Superinfection immunity protein